MPLAHCKVHILGSANTQLNTVGQTHDASARRINPAGMDTILSRTIGGGDRRSAIPYGNDVMVGPVNLEHSVLFKGKPANQTSVLVNHELSALLTSAAGCK